MVFKRTLLAYVLVLVVAIFMVSPRRIAAQSSTSARQLFEWEEQIPLPDLPTLIGVYGGFSNNVILLAGGLYQADAGEGDVRGTWADSIYVLRQTDDTSYSCLHRTTLRHPQAFGASVGTEEGVLCIGGRDGSRYYSEVFLLKWTEGTLRQISYPSLPVRCAYASAAKIGKEVYVAGGRQSPDSLGGMHNFWKLDLSRSDSHWEKLPAWPGPERFMAIAGADDARLYLAGGMTHILSPDGEQLYQLLSDAYSYHPNHGWKNITSLPRPVAGSLTPALHYGDSYLLIFGGLEDPLNSSLGVAQLFQPDLAAEIPAYHTITDTWTAMGTLPDGFGLGPLIFHNGQVILTGGRETVAAEAALYTGIPRYSKPRFGILNSVSLVAYFGILIWMGLYFARREKTTDDFFLAGRRIPWWAAGISIFGTQLSAITFMAIPAKAYATNWVFFVANMCIVLIAPVIVYVYLPFYRRLNITTAYEYLERRFNAAIRLFGGIAYILLQTGRMAIVIFLPAIALSTVTGMNIYLTVIIIGILSTFYTVLGGIEAVIWSDVLQAVVLLGGAILSLLLISAGVDGGMQGVLSVGLADDKFHMVQWTWDYTMAAVWVVLIGNTLNQLIPYSADQTVVQRYLTTRDERQAAKSIWTNAFMSIPASFLFFGLGTALYVFYKSHPGSLDPSLQTDAIFPLFIVQQMPAGVAGILIAGIFAAAMSSLDSSMNSVATVVVTDIYRRFKVANSRDRGLYLARWITLLLGIFATTVGVLMARFEIQSLWDLFLRIIGLFGGSLAGLFALGIFTRRANGGGAMIGAMLSAMTLFFLQAFTDAHFFLYGATGIVVCVITGYLFSLILPLQRQELDGLTIYTLSSNNYRQEKPDEIPT